MPLGQIGLDGMLERFYPDEYLDSAYEVEYGRMYREGYRGIIFDIDNTLVPHDAPADGRARQLFLRLREIGYRCCILSNNKEPRVRSFSDAVKARYIFDAGKPGVSGYLRAMELMGTDAGNTFSVGDQIFTDVCGSRRAGLHTVLVKPIHPKEKLQIVLKRIPERVVLYFYRRRRKGGIA